MKPRKQIQRSQKPIRKKSAKKIVEDKERAELKLAVIDRDGEKCKRCGVGAFWSLQLHELVSRGTGGKNEMDNCVLLCWMCHRDVTDHNCDDWREWVHVKKESM